MVPPETHFLVAVAAVVVLVVVMHQRAISHYGRQSMSTEILQSAVRNYLPLLRTAMGNDSAKLSNVDCRRLLLTEVLHSLEAARLPSGGWFTLFLEDDTDSGLVMVDGGRSLGGPSPTVASDAHVLLRQECHRQLQRHSQQTACFRSMQPCPRTGATREMVIACHKQPGAFLLVAQSP